MPLTPWLAVADLGDRPVLPGGDEEWAQVVDLATAVLHGLSGSRWSGRASRTVQIVAAGGAPRPDTQPWWDGSWDAHLIDGEIVNHDCCAHPPQVRLPDFPVSSVERVEVGGAVRDPAGYRLRDGRWLEDLTGRGWPVCDPGMVVAYTAGTDPPPGGVVAVRALALEIGRARAGDPRCRLPSNVTAITRQGISTSYQPASELMEQGRTGLPEVDLWLGTVNPSGRRHRPSSWSPDTAVRAYPRQEAP